MLLVQFPTGPPSGGMHALPWLSDAKMGFQQSPWSHEECEASGIPAKPFRHLDATSDDDGKDHGFNLRIGNVLEGDSQGL